MKPRHTLTIALAGAALVGAFVIPELGSLSESSHDDQDLPVATATHPLPDHSVLTTDDPVETAEARDVDIIVCLDTSGSMESLIDSARARLWDIVTEVMELEPNANLRVGLLTFGNPTDGASKADGYVLLRSDLTNDLDGLYDELFSLTTSGGDEYVGWAVDTALKQVSWSTEDNAAHIVFVAGNESADQGRNTRDFRDVMRQANEQGVVVNALFAGNESQGRDLHWDEVATRGGGVYAAIDKTTGTRQIATSYDDEIQALNDRLNHTYVSYGVDGKAKKARQIKQDDNAASMGIGSLVSRIGAKGSAAYDNSGWDMVDAAESEDFDVATIPEAQLPASMRDLDLDERRAHLHEKKAERAKLKSQLADLTKKRNEELEQERATAGKDGLDAAMAEALERQL